MEYTKKRSSDRLTRRTVLAAAGGMAAVFLAAPAAAAFSTDEARELIGRAVADINQIINSGKSEAAMLKEFERIFERYGDSTVIGQLVLGADGRTASASQKQAFAEAFKVYLARKYGRRFREFIGGRIEVIGAKPVKSFYEVSAVSHLAGQAPFDIGFVVADRNGRFIDMSIAGISLIKAERAEIGAMLDRRRGNLNQLIADLPTM